MRQRRLAQILLIASVLLCVSFGRAQPRNLLPKYGGLPEEEWQKEANRRFLAAIDEEYHGNRIKAAQDMAKRGWESMQQGNLEIAMQRFNQAWLLDNRNGRALWGMAIIQTTIGKFDDALNLLAEVKVDPGDQLGFEVDSAFVIGIAGTYSKNDALVKDALSRFESIHKKAPENGTNLRNWAMTLFDLGRYAETWEKVKLAETTRDKNLFDPDFLKKLESRMPRPKN